MIKEFYIEGTRKTPTVMLNPEGIIKIEGRSIPEDANLFFTDVMDWIEKYIDSPKEHTQVDISLEYLNSGTSKFVLQILKRLKDLSSNNHHNVTINWYYEDGDDDILERGEYYSTILDLKINYIEIE